MSLIHVASRTSGERSLGLLSSHLFCETQREDHPALASVRLFLCCNRKTRLRVTMYHLPESCVIYEMNVIFVSFYASELPREREECYRANMLANNRDYFLLIANFSFPVSIITITKETLRNVCLILRIFQGECAIASFPELFASYF